MHVNSANSALRAHSFPLVALRTEQGGARTAMIVCSCNVFSDQDVRTALSTQGKPRTMGQVYGCLGCTPQCGRCARTMPRIMDEAVLGACGRGCSQRDG